MPKFYDCDWQRATLTALSAVQLAASNNAGNIAAVDRSAGSARAALERLSALGERYLRLFRAARDAGGCLGRQRASLEFIFSRRRLQAMPAFELLSALDIAVGAIIVRSRGRAVLSVNEESPAKPRAALAPLEISAPIELSFFGSQHAGELVVSIAVRCAQDGVWPAVWRRPRLRGLTPEMDVKYRSALEHAMWKQLDASLAAKPLFSIADLANRVGIPEIQSLPLQFRAITNDHVSVIAALDVSSAQAGTRSPLPGISAPPTADEVTRIRTETLFDVVETKAKAFAQTKGWMFERTDRSVVRVAGNAIGLQLNGRLTCHDAAFDENHTTDLGLFASLSVANVDSPDRSGTRTPALVLQGIAGFFSTTITLKTLTAGQRVEWSVGDDVVEIRITDPGQ